MAGGLQSRSTVRVRLPGGLWHDGTCYHHASVRPLCGFDEESLLDARGELRAAQATSLLASCVAFDDLTGMDRAVLVDELSVGDREALLWHLRRATFGDQLDAVIECASCSEKLDISVEIGDMLHPPYEAWPQVFTEQFEGHLVRFRAPTGADQRAVAQQAVTDPGDAALQLLTRCVLSIDGGEVTQPPLVAEALTLRLAEIDRQAEALFDVVCPQCSAPTASMLDAAGHLLEEVAARSRYLYEEVHTLAWYYHWSEREILSLSAPKRRRYLELIDQSVGSDPFA